MANSPDLVSVCHIPVKCYKIPQIMPNSNVLIHHHCFVLRLEYGWAVHIIHIHCHNMCGQIRLCCFHHFPKTMAVHSLGHNLA